MKSGGRGELPEGEERPSATLEALARKCGHLAVEHGIARDRTPAEFHMVLDPEVHGTQVLFIPDGPRARLALETPFERYRMLPDGYGAMWAPGLGTVECEVAPHGAYDGWGGMNSRLKDLYARWLLDGLGLRPSPQGGLPVREWPERSAFADKRAHDEFVKAQIVGRREAQERDFRVKELDPNTRVRLDAGGGVTVSVGPCSDAWAVWHGHHDGTEDGSDPPVVRRYLTLRVEGAEVPDGARAAGTLERLGNAALFELDRATGVGLTLVRRRGVPTRGGRDPADAPSLPSRLSSEYDREPLSLYWYARSAGSRMPLLSFLAYYQVLEFYFPAYSPIARVEALREKLRELGAGEVGEDDIEGVLEAAGSSRKRLLPEERKQLMNVLERCVEPERLEGFLAGDEERERFYGSEESLTISRRGLPPAKGNGKSKDRRNRVAERIYDIRNRVVHAKADHDDLGPLLPFDPEAWLLRHDVELVAFLAREVLSASARPLGSEAGGTP